MLRTLAILLLVACAAEPTPPVEYPPLERVEVVVPEPHEPETITLTILATNDVHGHIERLPYLAGYVNNVRAARGADGGAVLLLSGGDMWQGTLASNMTEGAVMVRAFNAMRYDAAAVGNHEFDYGPVGDATTPQSGEDDPRGALVARAAEAEFPILTANILDAETGERVQWPGIRPSVLIERAGLKIGIIGLSTFETPETTISANVDDVRMAPLAATAEREAERLRREGADVVIVTAHAGGHCDDFTDPDDLSTCDENQEIVQVARRIPEGAVDAIVAGHTHRAIAHRVNGIPVMEQYSYGFAFGRTDLVIDRATRRVVEARMQPPHEVCQDRDVGLEECRPEAYEGAPVTPDAEVLAVAREALGAAADRLAQPLNVNVTEALTRSRSNESPLGNMLADLMLEVRDDADLAILNGGGVRADIPEGALTYGSLYETFPFDNRFAVVRLTGAQLRSLVAANLSAGGGTLIFAGLRVEARCQPDGGMDVVLRDRRNRRIRDDRTLTAVTSDYLALTPSFRALGDGAVTIEAGEPIRELLAARLRERGGEMSPSDFFDAERPRFRLPSPRPVRCVSIQ